MTTFLELCQKVAQRSGTVSGTQPSSVTGQTGRLAKVVDYTAEAWRQIQLLHPSWRWMRSTFSGPVSAGGTGKFTAASFNIDDFGSWILERNKRGRWNITLYLTATGVSDEGPLEVVDWDVWLDMYGRGSQDANRPNVVALSPANELCFGPISDAAYTCRGEYRTKAQVLEADDDEPNCPEENHNIVVWRALQLLHEHDEAAIIDIASANRNYSADLGALEYTQLPRVRIGSKPLA